MGKFKQIKEAQEEAEYLARFKRGPKQQHRRAGSKMAAAGEKVHRDEGSKDAQEEGSQPKSSGKGLDQS